MVSGILQLMFNAVDLIVVGHFSGQQALAAVGGTTGTLINEHFHLNVETMMSGPLGGDQQIGARVATEQVNYVIFLRDPLTSQPHEPDINALLRLCDVHNIPLATNRRSAHILLQYADQKLNKAQS